MPSRVSKSETASGINFIRDVRTYFFFFSSGNDNGVIERYLAPRAARSRLSRRASVYTTIFRYPATRFTRFYIIHLPKWHGARSEMKSGEATRDEQMDTMDKSRRVLGFISNQSELPQIGILSLLVKQVEELAIQAKVHAAFSRIAHLSAYLVKERHGVFSYACTELLSTQLTLRSRSTEYRTHRHRIEKKRVRA